ncbi:MAG: helix-turn-helix domain-containing protein [Halanaeroarchaeum sp.]
MPDAKLTVAVPTDTWMYDASTTHPEATFRVLTALVDGESAFGLLEVVTEDPLSLLGDLREYDDLTTVELVSADDRTAVVHIETTETALLDPAAAAGVPLQTPFLIESGTVEWELTTPDDRLSDLGAHLDDAGLSYQVEYVKRNGETAVAPEAVLTGRQAEVLALALDRGFFDIPREATVSDVAAALDISKSTASDILRRAQRNLTQWYFATADEAELPG